MSAAGARGGEHGGLARRRHGAVLAAAAPLHQPHQPLLGRDHRVRGQQAGGRAQARARRHLTVLPGTPVSDV